MTTPHTTIVNPLQDREWDQKVASQPDATFFHSSAWAHVLADSYGHQPRYLTFGRNGSTTAILPLMEMNSWLTGRRGVSLPFTDECRPLAPHVDERRELIQAAVTMGKDRGWGYYLSQGAGELLNGADRTSSTSPAVGKNPLYFTHTIDLKRPVEAIFQSFRDSVRRSIRKSEAAKLQLSCETSVEALREYYRLHCLTRKRHGLPPQPWYFFQQISRHVLAPGKGFIVLARAPGREAPIAGAVYLIFGRKAVYKFGASELAFQDLRPNNRVMWEAIQCLASRGVEELSLGRTSVQNAGLRRFKLGWNPEEQGLWHYKYDFRQSRAVEDSDGAHGWHNLVFRLMPTRLARLAGALLYRHWAFLVLANGKTGTFPGDEKCVQLLNL